MTVHQGDSACSVTDGAWAGCQSAHHSPVMTRNDWAHQEGSDIEHSSSSSSVPEQRHPPLFTRTLSWLAWPADAGKSILKRDRNSRMCSRVADHSLCEGVGCGDAGEGEVFRASAAPAPRWMRPSQSFFLKKAGPEPCLAVRAAVCSA